MINSEEIKLNDKLLVPIGKEAEQNLFTFSPTPAWYRAGLNVLSIRADNTLESLPEPPRVLTVEAHVQYVN